MRSQRSSRRRYLVAYDIANPERLRVVHKIVKAHGDPLQYSVFLCDLSPQELTGLKWQLGEGIHNLEDRVLFLDLGDPRDERAFSFLGQAPRFPQDGPVIL